MNLESTGRARGSRSRSPSAAVVPATAQGPIRIGASLSLTGTYAKLGKKSARGLPALREGPQREGRGARPQGCSSSSTTTQSMPATAVRLYEKLITEDKVDAIMGPYSSPVTEAAVNVTEKYKKVMVAPLAATTSIFKKGRKYIFMVPSRRPRPTSRASSTWRPSAGSKTVAVVNEDTLFSKAARRRRRRDREKEGGCRVVFAEALPEGQHRLLGPS